MSKKRLFKRKISIEGGKICPKCGSRMQRWMHSRNWKLPIGQNYYFKYWDTCQKCRRLQHYEEAKVHEETYLLDMVSKLRVLTEADRKAVNDFIKARSDDKKQASKTNSGRT